LPGENPFVYVNSFKRHRTVASVCWSPLIYFYLPTVGMSNAAGSYEIGLRRRRRAVLTWNWGNEM